MKQQWPSAGRHVKVRPPVSPDKIISISPHELVSVIVVYESTSSKCCGSSVLRMRQATACLASYCHSELTMMAFRSDPGAARLAAWHSRMHVIRTYRDGT